LAFDLFQLSTDLVFKNAFIIGSDFVTSQMNFFFSAQLSTAKIELSVEFLNSTKTQSPFAEGSSLFHLVPLESNGFPLPVQVKILSGLAFCPEVQKSPMKSL